MYDDLMLPQVPEAKPDDPEDVSWALSTAEAMWARGEHAEGIKWVRRAAEAASEAEKDERALELAKAAADLAGLVRNDEPALAEGDRKTVISAPPTPGAAPMTSRPTNAADVVRRATNAPTAVPRRPSSTNEQHDPGIATSQAVRVVVWRDANGVHVAPTGTVVSAITVDAVLVALEPNADLTAWLTRSAR